MCGLAGIISLNREGVNPTTVCNMLNRIKHRGPDDTGIFGYGYKGECLNTISTHEIPYPAKIMMGFNRLSIQDLSINGHQPMISDDKKIVLTFNGEIYNTVDLKECLGNSIVNALHGTSDTEIVLRVYEKYGMEAFHMLNGMFGIVLLDLNKHKLIFARDKWGIIPLHILIDKNYVAWSSEIKSFLEIPDFERKVDMVALSRGYLYYNPVCSLYKNVKDVPPGNYCEIDLWEKDTSKIMFKKYFCINEYLIKKTYVDEKDVISRYEMLLKDCVMRQMISDVPIGLQLSGGVDSTSIAYWATREVDDNNWLHTISLINSEEEYNNEWTRIEHVLKNLKCTPIFSYSDSFLFYNYFEQTIYAYEKLLGVQSGMAISSFTKEISKYATVLLSGEGADEICGGYGLGSEVLNNHFEFTDEYIYGFDRQLMLYENGKNMLYDFDLGDIYTERNDYLNSIEGDTAQKIEALWMKEELVCLLERQNKITMSHSVENRVPFLDDRMVEFMLSLPCEYIERNCQYTTKQETKYVIKKACAKYYGDDFAFMQKKGIAFQISRQITNSEFVQYLNEMIIPKMKQRGVINMKEFLKRYARMSTGQDVVSVWKAICIETWFQLFVDGRDAMQRL